MKLGEPDKKGPEPAVSEELVKDVKRSLMNAERQIKKLQQNLASQKQQVRELRAQVRCESDLAAQRDELKGEVVDLKGEIRELTRANREQAGKIEALRSGLAKACKPKGPNAHGDPQALGPRLF